ncbi:acyltransferase family protein [Herbiconiux ginsengi]|uniref:Acyltransferase family protein n=1 Tax=Herbiconiux ginsengi TaxID=381665 RepID=A0A1H3KL79_9MICO|nr:acyltransferase [Herbiconiux ginsengi]SDY52942.1 Acyltransferase family protein [Herbiconiux ginsengi]
MSVITGIRTPASVRHRDRSVDLVRSFLLLVVVGLHSTMAGISVGPHGVLLENALENQGWFGPVTWVVQIMPLFFLVGGFSSHRHWTRMREQGHSASDYVAGRLRRLLVPALVSVVAVGFGLALMTVSGVPAGLVATAGFRISQPLWFLGVYVLCSAFVPLLVAAHLRRPVLSLAGLVTAAVAVDVLRFGTDGTALGFLNLLFVWLALQQLGFWLAAGRLDALSVRTRVVIAAGSVVALVLLTVPGPYPVDMLQNLNPPTVCLIVLGVAQLMVFTLLRERLREIAEHPGVGSVVDALGSRAMTAYLWHMPVIVALAGGLLALHASAGVPLPEPLSAGWWVTRPLWLLAVGIAVLPVAAGLGRFENGTGTGTARFLGSSRRARTRIASAVVLGSGSVVLLLATGISLAAVILAVGMLVGALALAGARPR